MPLVMPPRIAVCTEDPIYSALAINWFVMTTSYGNESRPMKAQYRTSLPGEPSISWLPSASFCDLSWSSLMTSVAVTASANPW